MTTAEDYPAQALHYTELVALDREGVALVHSASCGRVAKVFRHQRLWRKLLFFIFREGFLRVWQKYRSARFGQYVAEQEVFVVARDRRSNTFHAGFQHTLRQPVYYFLPEAAWPEQPGPAHYKELDHFNPFLGHRPKTFSAPTAAAPGTFKPITLTRPPSVPNSRGDLLVIGCGDYARSTAMPSFARLNRKLAVDFNFEILDAAPFRHFEIRSNDFRVIERLADSGTEKVAIVATYHSFHTEQALALLGLPRCKVILEKPPCVTRTDLRRLLAHYDPARVFIGYNRRFIPWNEIVRDLIASASGPVIANLIITEVQITADHWYFAPLQGTRICGNLCHWVDLAVYWMNRRPRSVSIARNPVLGVDGSALSLVFEDGSLFTFSASDLGDGTRGVQESINIRNENFEVRIEDYVRMTIWNRGRVRTYRCLRRDKGHGRMYQAFSRWIAAGNSSPYSTRDLAWSTLSYLAMVDLAHGAGDSLVLDFEALEREGGRLNLCQSEARSVARTFEQCPERP